MPLNVLQWYIMVESKGGALLSVIGNQLPYDLNWNKGALPPGTSRRHSLKTATGQIELFNVGIKVIWLGRLTEEFLSI